MDAVAPISAEAAAETLYNHRVRQIRADVNNQYVEKSYVARGGVTQEVLK